MYLVLRFLWRDEMVWLWGREFGRGRMVVSGNGLRLWYVREESISRLVGLDSWVLNRGLLSILW